MGCAASGPLVGGVGWARRWPEPAHETCGSVPAMNAIGTGRTHSPEGSSSTRRVTTPSGTGKSSLGLSAMTLFMYTFQIGNATHEPVSSPPRLRFQSYPTHTPGARRRVKTKYRAMELRYSVRVL